MMRRTTLGTQRRGAKSVSGCTLNAVALRLSAYADSDGSHMFPGLARIAIDLEITVETAKRAVAILRELGLIERIARATSRGRADLYRLTEPTNLLDRDDIHVMSTDEYEAAIERLAATQRTTRTRAQGPEDPVRDHDTPDCTGSSGTPNQTAQGPQDPLHRVLRTLPPSMYLPSVVTSYGAAPADVVPVSQEEERSTQTDKRLALEAALREMARALPPIRGQAVDSATADRIATELVEKIIIDKGWTVDLARRELTRSRGTAETPGIYVSRARSMPDVPPMAVAPSQRAAMAMGHHDYVRDQETGGVGLDPLCLRCGETRGRGRHTAPSEAPIVAQPRTRARYCENGRAMARGQCPECASALTSIPATVGVIGGCARLEMLAV